MLSRVNLPSNTWPKYGFEEILLSKAPKPDAPKSNDPPMNPIKAMAEQLIKTGLLSSKSPLEKLKGNTNPENFIISIYETIKEFNPQIADAIKREAPDVFILDHFFIPPAIPQSDVPWLFLFSGNPIHLYNSDKLPPFGSGKFWTH